jgi:hypothetical protein
MEHFAKNSKTAAVTIFEEGQKLHIQEGLAQLKASHLIIEGLFEQYFSQAHPIKKQLCLVALCERVAVHITLLTSWFYPAVLDVLGSPEDVSAKIILKYAQFKQLITELETIPPHSDLCERKVAVLKEYFRFHVKEEETITFPKIRKSSLNLLALGRILHNAQLQIEREMLHGSMLTSINAGTMKVIPPSSNLLH